MVIDWAHLWSVGQSVAKVLGGGLGLNALRLASSAFGNMAKFHKWTYAEKVVDGIVFEVEAEAAQSPANWTGADKRRAAEVKLMGKGMWWASVLIEKAVSNWNYDLSQLADKITYAKPGDTSAPAAVAPEAQPKEVPASSTYVLEGGLPHSV